MTDIQIFFLENRHRRVWISYSDAKATGSLLKCKGEPIIRGRLIEASSNRPKEEELLVSLYQEDGTFSRMARFSREQIILHREPKHFTVNLSD